MVVLESGGRTRLLRHFHRLIIAARINLIRHLSWHVRWLRHAIFLRVLLLRYLLWVQLWVHFRVRINIICVRVVLLVILDYMLEICVRIWHSMNEKGLFRWLSFCSRSRVLGTASVPLRRSVNSHVPIFFAKTSLWTVLFMVVSLLLWLIHNLIRLVAALIGASYDFCALSRLDSICFCKTLVYTTATVNGQVLFRLLVSPRIVQIVILWRFIRYSSLQTSLIALTWVVESLGTGNQPLGLILKWLAYVDYAGECAHLLLLPFARELSLWRSPRLLTLLLPLIVIVALLDCEGGSPLRLTLAKTVGVLWWVRVTALTLSTTSVATR